MLNKERDSGRNEVRELRGKRAKLEREARSAEWESKRKEEKEAEGPPPLPFAEDLQCAGIFSNSGNIFPGSVQRSTSW